MCPIWAAHAFEFMSSEVWCQLYRTRMTLLVCATLVIIIVVIIITIVNVIIIIVIISIVRTSEASLCAKAPTQ